MTLRLRAPWTALILLAACSSTTLTGSWKDESYREGYLRSALVIGVASEEQVRRVFEDAFVARLEERRVEAIPSYRLFPDERGMSREAVDEEVRRANIQAILVTRVLRRETETVESPGSTRVDAYPRGGRWHGYYSRSYEITHTPSQTTTFEVVTLESNLYSTKTDDLVWSATFRTTVDEFENQNQRIASFVSRALESLQKEDLVR
jgi:hypothetical protein